MSVYGPLPSPTAVSHSSPAGVAGPASFLHPNHAFFNNNSNNNNKMQQHLHPLNDYSADFRMLPSNLHLPSPSANLFERSMNALVSNFKGTIAKSSYDNIQPNTTTLSGPHDDWAWENALAGYSNNNNDIDERDLEGQDLLGLFTTAHGNLTPQQQPRYEQQGSGSSDSHLPGGQQHALSPATDNLFQLENGQSLLTPGGSLRNDLFTSPQTYDNNDFANYQPYTADDMLPLSHPLDTAEFKNPAFDYIVGSFLDTIESMTPATSFNLNTFDDIVRPVAGSQYDNKPIQYHQDMLLLNFEDVAASIAMKKQPAWASGPLRDDNGQSMDMYQFVQDNQNDQQQQPQQPPAPAPTMRSHFPGVDKDSNLISHAQANLRRSSIPAANIHPPLRTGPGAGAAASRYSPPKRNPPPQHSQSQYLQQHHLHHAAINSAQLTHSPPSHPSQQHSHRGDRPHPYKKLSDPNLLAKAPVVRSHPPQSQMDVMHMYNTPGTTSYGGSAPPAPPPYHSSNPPIFPCPTPNCSKVFGKYVALTQHLSMHHGTQPMVAQKTKPYHCTMCPQTFSRSHDLKRHYYIHTQEKPYRCKRCSKGFSRRDALRRHEKSVAEGKKVHCREGDPGNDDEEEEDEDGSVTPEDDHSNADELHEQQQQQQQQHHLATPPAVSTHNGNSTSRAHGGSSERRRSKTNSAGAPARQES